MQVQQLEVISFPRDAIVGMPEGPADLALGGRPGTEVDRAIGSVRCLIVQLDSRIGYAKRTVMELEQVRSRLIDGLRDISHAGS